MASTRERRASFIATKEHRRFCEFADAVRRERYIGLCYGQAGVGKTVSARRYARWDVAEPLLETWGPREESDARVYEALWRSRTVFFTPTVTISPRELKHQLGHLIGRVEACIGQHPSRVGKPPPRRGEGVELVIIDEAERLTATALEILRDDFDRGHHGLVLVGMPGIEKRLARYPQLYSRVGFAHHYRALSDEELAFVLSHHWGKLGLELDLTDFTDAQAIAAIARITSGNFRLLQRLFVQIERILKINDLHLVTSDVVESARTTLVIGSAN